MGDQTGTRESIQGGRDIWENTQALGYRACGRESRVVGRAQACFEVSEWGPCRSSGAPRHSTCSKWVIPLPSQESLRGSPEGTERVFRCISRERERGMFQLSDVKAEGVSS